MIVRNVFLRVKAVVMQPLELAVLSLGFILEYLVEFPFAILLFMDKVSGKK